MKTFTTLPMCIPLGLCVFATTGRIASAIDGPTAIAIPNANWGGAIDRWPYSPRLEIDLNGIDSNGDGDRYNDPLGLTGDTFCSGTLIAPNVVVTAAHCFERFLAPGANIPADRVRVNFGNLPAGPSTILNSGGRIHPNVVLPIAIPSPHDLAYVTLNNVPDPLTVTPIPILPRPPRAGGANPDLNHAVGFGIGNASGPGPAGAPSFGIRQHLGGPPGRGAGAKGWSIITSDGLTAAHITQTMVAPEDFTEGGDSGGPGLFISRAGQNLFGLGLIPDRAYPLDWDNRGKNTFVMSAVHGGPLVTVNPGPPPTFGYPAAPNNVDYWTRLDVELPFLNGAMNSLAGGGAGVVVTHNLDPNPGSLAPGTPQCAVVQATYSTAGGPYVFHPVVWEEDTQLIGQPSFNGDVSFSPTLNFDDMAGMGYQAGILPAGVNRVFGWDCTTAGGLAPYSEPGNPLDPPGVGGLDWALKMNYDDAYRDYIAANFTNLAGVMGAIAFAQSEIAAGRAIQGAFALVPEPATLALLGLGAAVLLRRWR